MVRKEISKKIILKKGKRIIPIKKVEWFKNERKATPSIKDAILEDQKKSRQKKIALAILIVFVLFGISGFLFYSKIITLLQKDSSGEKQETIPDDIPLSIEPPAPIPVAPMAEKKEKASPIIMIVITKTPTGWLNVRNGPGISYTKIARVRPGEEYVLLEESGGWYKIRADASTTGWVTSQYAKKK